MWRNCLMGQFRPQRTYISDLCLKRWNASKSNKSDAPNKSGESQEDYSTPHPPRDPPAHYNPSGVHHTAFEVPDFIPPASFRRFKDINETLGPSASKKSVYKNPEYFSYHRYSYADLAMAIGDELQKRIDQRGVQTMYPAEEGSDSDGGSSSSNSDSDSDSDSTCS